jgi:hypothetical protein
LPQTHRLQHQHFAPAIVDEISPLRSLRWVLESGTPDETHLEIKHANSYGKAKPLFVHNGPATHDQPIITATDCQPIAAPDPRLDSDCFPAKNQSSETAMPPKSQCLAAKSERVLIEMPDYSRGVLNGWRDPD